ncbi:MAG TPA: CvpA family protein [Firmicutes bacterium]|nr:CvpA family protein [Bacillota bacterium]
MKQITLKRVLAVGAATLAAAVVFWFMLPAINPLDPNFWIFLAIVAAFYAAAILFTGDRRALASTAVKVGKGPGGQNIELHLPKSKGLKIAALVVLAGLAAAGLLWLIGQPVFNASRYRDLLVRQEGSFTEDIAELSMDQIPVVDRDTAQRLGARKLGEMSDLVSQFEIAPDYTQINLNDRPVRVTPLVYGDIIKWFNNNSQGIPAYIQVDMVTQETTLVRLEEGMKYAPCEYLMRDLQRYLRFHYPTKIFDNYSFEVDEDGTPYWIAPTIRYRIGVWGGRDISGVVLVNAVTGEHRFYPLEEIPQWVDQVYRADIVIEQLTYNGKYQDGFWNAYFGQKGVLRPTEGYNYIAMNDDVYLYTGMTSVASDQSNVGFVLVNMRTKDTRFYSVPGAEELSAMSSAEGQVQHLNYTATFPLLLNVADRPTYFLSLKDAAGLVKMYAFVDVERYQVVGTGATVDEAQASYVKALSQEADVDAGGGEEKAGVIERISSAVVDGNTRYYFTLKGDAAVYVAAIQVSDRLPFLAPGDSVALRYAGGADGGTCEVLSLQ